MANLWFAGGWQGTCCGNILPLKQTNKRPPGHPALRQKYFWVIWKILIFLLDGQPEKKEEIEECIFFSTLSIYFSCPARLMLLFHFLYNLQKFNLFFQSVPSQASLHQLCSHCAAATYGGTRRVKRMKLPVHLRSVSSFFDPLMVNLQLKFSSQYSANHTFLLLFSRVREVK